MPIVEKSTQARIDLLGIWRYVADETAPELADRLLDRIDRCCEVLSEYPKMGRQQSALASELRSFPVESFIVFYRPIDDGVEVVRVLHESRDFPSEF